MSHIAATMLKFGAVILGLAVAHLDDVRGEAVYRKSNMTAARRASAFTQSLAVQIHMNYNADWGSPQSPYAVTSTVTAALKYLNPIGIGTGVGTVRDSTFYPNATTAQNIIGALGYKFDLFMGFDGSHINYSDQYAAITALIDAGMVRVVEGGLEVDGFGLATGDSYIALDGISYTGWAAPVAMQIDVWNQFHTKVPVALFSLANPSNGASQSPAVAAASKLGVVLKDYCNYGNVHFFQGHGQAPASPVGGQLKGVIGQETGYTSGLPYMITEAGFVDVNGEGYYGNAAVNAKYTLNLLLDAFVGGATMLSLYELLDENMGYLDSDIPQDHFGLFNANGTPKQAAVALNNLLSVVGDPGPQTFTPASLDYEISGLPSGGNSTLLQKSDGSFILAIWIDYNLYSMGVMATAPLQTITVKFSSPGTIETYDPMANAARFAGSFSFATDISDLGHLSTTKATSVQVTVTDHPILIKLTPVSAVPAESRPLGK